MRGVARFLRFDSREDTEPRGTLVLTASVHVQDTLASGKNVKEVKFPFQIALNGAGGPFGRAAYEMSADTELERTQWMDTLDAVLEARSVRTSRAASSGARRRAV